MGFVKDLWVFWVLAVVLKFIMEERKRFLIVWDKGVLSVCDESRTIRMIK